MLWWHLCPCWVHPNPCHSRLLWVPMFAAAGCTAFIPSFLLHPSFLLPLQEVTSQPVMGFDPLPPLDSVVSYTRPERYHLHCWCLHWHSHLCSSTALSPRPGCTQTLRADILPHGRGRAVLLQAGRATGWTGPAASCGGHHWPFPAIGQEPGKIQATAGWEGLGKWKLKLQPVLVLG